MSARHNMGERRPCPNLKCNQWNGLDARFCARCGTRLAGFPAVVPAPSQHAPHWGFTAFFICFFLVLLAPLLYAAGPIMLLILPCVAFGLKWGAGNRRSRRSAWHVMAGGERRL